MKCPECGSNTFEIRVRRDIDFTEIWEYDEKGNYKVLESNEQGTNWEEILEVKCENCATEVDWE
jgi:Zn finger protein HypA/HybF involved in hydrogenase expression